MRAFKWMLKGVRERERDDRKRQNQYPATADMTKTAATGDLHCDQTRCQKKLKPGVTLHRRRKRGTLAHGIGLTKGGRNTRLHAVCDHKARPMVLSIASCSRRPETCMIARPHSAGPSHPCRDPPTTSATGVRVTLKPAESGSTGLSVVGFTARSVRFRALSRPPANFEAKKPDQPAGSDDLAVKRQATWEMSVDV